MATAPLFMLCGSIEVEDDGYAAIEDWLAAAPPVVRFDALEIDGDGYDIDAL